MAGLGMGELMSFINGGLDEPLDNIIYKSIVYTVINDLRTYGETSCFYESMSADDRSKLYALSSFVNSATVKDLIIKQALLDNRQFDMEKSLIKSNLISFINSNLTFINDNGLLGRLISLCSKIDEVDIFVSSENYSVSDLIEDDNTITALFNYFTPNDTTYVLSFLLGLIIESYNTSAIPKFIDMGLLEYVESGASSEGTVTASYNGSGFLIGVKLNRYGTASLNSGDVSAILDGGNSISLGYAGGESMIYSGNKLEIFYSSVSVTLQRLNQTGGTYSYGVTMYILPK